MKSRYGAFMTGRAASVDAVERIVEQWTAVRPDLDSAPIAVVGRISRLSRLIDRRLAENFARFGIENWMYDVLATIRRGGAPYERTAGELVSQTMVTTGAMTNRIDRLEARGFVERTRTADRRKVVVRLTDAGRELVDEVAVAHLAVERALLAGLSARQQGELAALLRTVLIDLGDVPDTSAAG
jgi:DNA-binding MarR family transcriptional regulator